MVKIFTFRAVSIFTLSVALSNVIYELGSYRTTVPCDRHNHISEHEVHVERLIESILV